LSNYKVLMTDTIFPDMEIERSELATIGAELVLASGSDPKTLAREGKDCDAMIVVYAPITAEVINSLTKCKIMVRTGIGFNNIDLEAASRKGIMVANVPDYCQDEVADHAMALFLSGVRKVAFLNARVKAGSWDVNEAKPIPRLRGKLFGLFGLGSIGQRVAERAKAFGMDVCSYDPYMPQEVFDKLGVKRFYDFDEFLASVDFLSIHAPLTEETKHIINLQNLRKMKRTAFIVNTSRGPLIDEKDLYIALKEGVIAGAGIDVLENEPPAHPFPLAELDNIILTPHAAFYSEESEPELRRKAAQEVVRTLKEGRPKHWVNKKMMEQLGTA